MKLVRLEKSELDGSFLYDPDPYLAEIESLARLLPPGARSFATDPNHYDFGSLRCVKDLELINWTNNLSDWSVELNFAGNQFKHEQCLRIEYDRVSRIEGNIAPAGYVDGGPRVQLDEILPAGGGGVAHEISFVSGAIRVFAQDLRASWI